MKYSLLIFLFLLTGIYSCKKNRFKKNEFLEQLYTLEIKPELKNANNTLTQFIATWNNYKLSPSSISLSAVKTGLKTTLSKLEEISIYNMGDISKTYVYNRIFKTNIDTAAMHAFYNGQNSFTKEDFNPEANPTKGIFALEYLFFSAPFMDSLESPKFQNYASAMLENLNSNFNDFTSNWETYKETFITQTDEGVSDSYNIVLNRLIHVLEDITKKRISQPIELKDPTLLPGYVSNSSIQNIKIINDKMKVIYYGNGANGDFNSIAINVKKKNKKLAKIIDEQFEDIAAKKTILIKNVQDYIPEPKGDLVAYNESLKGLLVLLKVDVTQELGIIVTFGDTDGD